MEYYLSIKRNEMLTHAVVWMNLEDSVLRQTSQTQKNKECLLALYEVPGVDKSAETERRKGRRERAMGSCV